MLKNPELLLLLPVTLVLVAMRLRRRRRACVRHPAVAALRGRSRGPRAVVARVGSWPWVVAALLALVAAAMPMRVRARLPDPRDGVDVMLVLDMSSSMRIQDMRSQSGNSLSRSEAAKQEALAFVGMRPEDRFGLIRYTRFALTAAPLTFDHRMLGEIVREMQPALPGSLEDRTSTGDALALAVRRLHRSQARSRVIVLISDGRSNAGRFGPQEAAALAAEAGLRVHSIGVGAGNPPKSALDFIGTVPTLDEASLRSIARLGNGRYFRAGSVQGFRRAMAEIDSLEKSPQRRSRITAHSPAHQLPAVLALVVCVAWLVCESVWLKRSP